MADETPTAKKPLPPYMPYKTFTSFLEHLRAIGLPSHIDKSVMASLSGGIQSWLKAAFRYMDLIDDDNAPTARLEKLVASKDDARKAALLDLFKHSYSFLKVDLKNSTPEKVKAAINALGATGETTEKVMAFMVAMAKDAGVPLSTLLTTRAPRKPRNKNTPRQTPTPAAKPPRGNQGNGDDDQGKNGNGTENAAAMKSIKLPKSGGTLTLSGSINVFALVGDERDLVFKLIDAMRKFEEEGSAKDA